MKKLKVEYTFKVTREVEIRGDNIPAPYEADEWEQQQIEDAGYEIEQSIGGRPDWHYDVKEATP